LERVIKNKKYLNKELKEEWVRISLKEVIVNR
jgi:hypothetical protein